MNKQLILYLLVWLDGLVFPCFVLTSYVGRVRVSVCVSVCVPQDCQCASGGVSGCVWTSEEAVVCIFVFGVILFLRGTWPHVKRHVLGLGSEPGVFSGYIRMSVSEFPPVVPFASFSEYEEMLDCLIREYQGMVVQASERTTQWYHIYEGVEWIVRFGWLEHGELLFLRFTKGLGKEWCRTMNRMVVHSLHTAVRVLVQTRKQVNKPLSRTAQDNLIVAALLKQETALAIADRCSSDNNMYEFECQNFRFIRDDNNEDGGDFLTVGQVQAMTLAFAMLSHPRLGCAAAGKTLGYDIIKLVLSKFSEPRN